MTRYYVSNTASNGYALGNDANSGLTMALPKLTIVGAHAAAAASGDDAWVNPTATEYAENSGSGYLSITKQFIVRSDPTISGQKATIVAGVATNRVANLNAPNVILDNFNVDAKGASTSAITQQVQLNNLVSNVRFKNLASTFGGVSVGTGGALGITLDKCIADAADGNSVGSRLLTVSAGNAAAQMILKGCTARGIGWLYYSASSLASLKIQTVRSDDGTFNTVDACTGGVKYSGNPATNVDIQDINYVNMSDVSGYGLHDNNDSSSNTTSFKFKNITYNGSQTRACFLVGRVDAGDVSLNVANVTGGSAFIETRNVLITNLKVKNNTITGVTHTSDAINIQTSGAGTEASDNTITTDSDSNHGIAIGGDGMFQTAANTATATGQQNVGALAENVYVYNKFTMIAAASQNNAAGVGAYRCFVRKVGTPLGNLVAKLYTNNAGVPGTLLDTSEFTLTGALLTSSIYVEFPFPINQLLSYATDYFIRLEYTGTPDAVNYFQVDYNATVGASNGTIKGIGTSADGTVWVADNTKALLAGYFSMNRECVNPLAEGNVITNTNPTATLFHNILIGSTTGGKIRRNRIKGSGIGGLFKLTDGRATTAVMANNLCYIYQGASAGQQFRDKGSRSVQIYHNNGVVRNVAAYNVHLDADYVATGAFLPTLNGQASRNPIVKNNILYRAATSIAGYNYYFGNRFGAAIPSVVAPIVNNNNVYAGANTTTADNNISGSQVIQNFAAWQAAGYDTLGSNSDPLLPSYTPNAVTDYIPSPSSPANDLGANTNGVVPTDFYGNVFRFTPDAGAFDLYSQNLAGSLNAKVYNPFTDELDFIGMQKAVTDTFYAPAIQQLNLTSAAAIPPIPGIYEVTGDATTAAFTVLLPDATLVRGTRVSLTKIDASGNAVTLSAITAQLINSALTKVQASQYSSVSVFSNGVKWIIESVI